MAALYLLSINHEKKENQWNNITGKEILAEMGWFWLGNVAVSGSYESVLCCCFD